MAWPGLAGLANEVVSFGFLYCHKNKPAKQQLFAKIEWSWSFFQCS